MARKATEANEDMMRDAHTYEFAFHILPTVVGTEVADVVDSITKLVAENGGEVTGSESPQRIELAYEIDKVIDGSHKRFHSAYFGWIRMTINAEGLLAFKEEIEHMPTILRSLVVKLSKEEIEHPFKYHETHKAVAEETETETEIAEADADNESVEETAETDETVNDDADTDAKEA